MIDTELSPGLYGLFVSAFISATIAPGGSEAFLAWMIKQSGQPPGILIFIATFGNTLGALTTWLFGNWAEKGVSVEKLIGRQHKTTLQTVRKWGVSSLLLSWFPVIGDGLCFAAGWLHLPFFHSLCAIVLGKALRYTAIAWALI
ncbi:DedA family protein [bacterium]|nr:DedA family protein [bacterium]